MIVTFYHIAGILAGVFTVLGIILKFVMSHLKKCWNEDMTKKMKKMEDKFEKMEDKFEEDLKEHKEVLERELKEEVKGTYEGLEKDLARTNKSIDEIKDLIKAQQETLLTIQLGITELKPRLSNLEDRVDKIEERINHRDND